MADTSIKKTEIIKKQVSLDTNLNEKTKTEDIKTAKRPLSDAEIEAKLNQIINDIQHGNISVEDAVAALAELGIVAQITTKNLKTVFKFMFKGKQYTVYYTPKVIEKITDKIDSPVVKIDEPISAVEPKVVDENVFKPITGQITDVGNIQKPVNYDSYLDTYRKQLNALYCPDDIFDDIMQQLENELNSYVSKNGVINLRKHLNEVFENLVHVLDGRENINVDVLFGDKDEISPSEFMEFIEKLGSANETFSEQDSAVFQKLNELIQGLKDKYSIQNSYDEEDLIKCIMILMNQAAGVENKGNVTITQDTIKNLNKRTDGFFETLDKNLNTDDNLDDGIDCTNLDKLYYFGINGQIDNFGQGKTGDCWLLAAIAALNVTEYGQQIIKNSIETITKTDENGVEREYIRVTFNGIGISYDISYEEMVEARMIREYSDGDNDVQAIELATEKLRQDIDRGDVFLIYGNYSGSEGINGGWEHHMLYYLTGNPPVTLTNIQNLEALNSIYEKFSSGNYAIYFSLGYYDDVEAVTTTGEVFEWRYGVHHALAITEITENTITIVNPWNSDKPYEFTWEEFIKLKTIIGITPIQEPMTLDEFDEKLQGNEFDKNVSGVEIKSYLINYSKRFVDDLESKYFYNEGYVQLLEDFISNEIISQMYNDSEKYNLKDAFNELKNMFDELTNPLNECIVSSIENDDGSYLRKFANLIISKAYNNSKDYVELDENQFRELLIKYLAHISGKTDELEQTGSINLTEIIQDFNGNSFWLDELYQETKGFVRDLNAIDYDKKITINGEEYTLSEIISSTDPIIFNINNKWAIGESLAQLFEEICNTALKNLHPTLKNRIIHILKFRYSELAQYTAGTNQNYTGYCYYNPIYDRMETLEFSPEVAESYGITKTDGWFPKINIDITVLIKKMLELYDCAMNI